MADLSSLTTFLGWTLVLHFVFLCLAAVMLTVARGFVLSLHTSLLDMSEEQLKVAYLNFLTYYKIGIYLFSFVPYLALKIMGY